MLCSDNELKEKIIKEIPNDSFENKEKLINNIRIWCYENIPVFEINKLQDTIVLEDGTREYKPVWITKKLYEIYNDFKNRGFWCSGHSMFLSKIYGMFGFKSDVIAYGFRPIATHAMTIVDWGEGYYIQDCYLNIKFLTSYNEILKIIGEYDSDKDKDILDKIKYEVEYNSNKIYIEYEKKKDNFQNEIIDIFTKECKNVTGVNDFRIIFTKKL